MKKAPNNKITRVVKPYAIAFYESNGRLPRPKEAMLDLAGKVETSSYDAVRKCLKRLSNMDPSTYTLSKAGSKILEEKREKIESLSVPIRATTEDRIRDVRFQLEILLDSAKDGNVDALAYDRLVRLERQLTTWKKADAEAALSTASDIAPPAVEACLKYYQLRTQQGLNAGGPQDA